METASLSQLRWVLLSAWRTEKLPSTKMPGRIHTSTAWPLIPGPRFRKHSTASTKIALPHRLRGPKRGEVKLNSSYSCRVGRGVNLLGIHSQLTPELMTTFPLWQSIDVCPNSGFKLTGGPRVGHMQTLVRQAGTDSGMDTNNIDDGSPTCLREYYFVDLKTGSRRGGRMFFDEGRDCRL